LIILESGQKTSPYPRPQFVDPSGCPRPRGSKDTKVYLFDTGRDEGE
jgi:hypothetical protein